MITMMTRRRIVSVMTFKETDSDSFEEVRFFETEIPIFCCGEIFQERDTTFDRPRMQTLGLLTADSIYSNLGRCCQRRTILL